MVGAFGEGINQDFKQKLVDTCAIHFLHASELFSYDLGSGRMNTKMVWDDGSLTQPYVSEGFSIFSITFTSGDSLFSSKSYFKGGGSGDGLGELLGGRLNIFIVLPLCN